MYELTNRPGSKRLDAKYPIISVTVKASDAFFVDPNVKPFKKLSTMALIDTGSPYTVLPKKCISRQLANYDSSELIYYKDIDISVTGYKRIQCSVIPFDVWFEGEKFGFVKTLITDAVEYMLLGNDFLTQSKFLHEGGEFNLTTLGEKI